MFASLFTAFSKIREILRRVFKFQGLKFGLQLHSGIKLCHLIHVENWNCAKLKNNDRYDLNFHERDRKLRMIKESNAKGQALYIEENQSVPEYNIV